MATFVDAFSYQLIHDGLFVTHELPNIDCVITLHDFIVFAAIMLYLLAKKIKNYKLANAMNATFESKVSFDVTLVA